MSVADNIVNALARRPDYRVFGTVKSILGLIVEVAGATGSLAVGDHCRVLGRKGREIACRSSAFATTGR